MSHSGKQTVDPTVNIRAEIDPDARDRFESSFELAPIGLAHVAPDGSWQAVNLSLRQMLGYERDELLALKFQQLTHPDDLPQDIEFLHRMLAGDIKQYSMEKRYRRKNGETLWANVTASLARDKDTNAPLHFITAVVDISARKRIEDELRDSEERLRLAVDGARIGTWQWDIAGNVLSWSETTRALLGFPPGGPPTYDMFMEAIHPDDRERTQRAITDAVECRAGYDIGYRAVWPDGSLHWQISRGRCYYDDHDAPIRMEGIVVDVTDLRKAEEKLSRSQDDLAFAVGAAELGTFYCDLPLDKIVWNETCKRHFFLPADADVDFDLFYSMLHPDDREPTRLAIERAMDQHAQYNVEYRTLGPEDQIRWLNAFGRFHYGADGLPTRFDGITIDITTRKTAEIGLRERAAREALLSRISTTIRGALTPDAIQEAAAAALGEALGADRCFYLLYNVAENIARVGGDYHRPHLPSVAGRYHLSDFQAMLSSVFPDQRTAVIPDVRAKFEIGVARQMETYQHRAVLAIPFFDGGNIVAALWASMADAPRQWTAAETELIEEVATLTRTALETARVIQKEHTIAQQLQAALRPEIPKRAPGLALADYYRPALEEAGVGGDFSDVFGLGKGVTVLIVGDLSGKGLAAASQVAMVRHMLRFALHNGRTLAEPIACVNTTLADNGLLSGFATLFVGRYEAETRLLTYVNCGQDAGLILRSESGRIETMPPTGPVLGAFSGAKFTEKTVEMTPGDVVAVYTDGFTEAGPNRMSMLTGEGVAALLREQTNSPDAQDIAGRITAGVDAFAGNGVRDDQCLLIAVVIPEL